MNVNHDDNSLNKLLEGEGLRNSFHSYWNHSLYLTDEQVEVLDRYQIPYRSCQNMSELSFLIEDFLNQDLDGNEELEEVAQSVDDYRYYHDISH